MSKEKLHTYRPSIDPVHSEGGQELGINLISNVVTPAVKIRGVAFTAVGMKSLYLQDNLKLRIAGPVLVPDDIYRDDEDEEYFMRFTIEDIETLAKDFMSKLTTRGKDVFNLLHTDEMVEKSYLLEAILADSPAKVSMIKEDYGIEVKQGTFFIVQQFTDKAVYDDIVARGATSFSFEGFLGTELIKEHNFKMSAMSKNVKMSAMKNPHKLVGVKRVMMSASKKKFTEVSETEELILIADEFKEGSDIVVIEDVIEGAVEDFTGEVEVTIEGVAEVLIVEDGVITEVVTEEATEEVVETEMEDVKKDEELEMEDAVVTEVVAPVATAEAVTKEDLESIYKILADIKSELTNVRADITEEIESTEDVSKVAMNQKFSATLQAFNKFNSGRKR